MTLQYFLYQLQEGAVSAAKIDAENQRNAMAKLVQDLIGERLLELSRYVTLSPFSKTVIVEQGITGKQRISLGNPLNARYVHIGR